MARIRMFVGVIATAVAMLLSGAASAAVPVVAKAFVDPANTANPSPSIVVGGVAGMAYVILNPNPEPLTGVNFTDALPAGMRINPTNGFISGDCSGVIDAGPNATTVTFTGGSVPAAGGDPVQPGKCTLILVVQGVVPGAWQNTFSVNSSAGTSEPASDTLTVTAAPPTVAKAFVDPNNTGDLSPAIPVGGVAGLAYVITNINPGQLTDVNFVDPLPAGMKINPTNGFISGDCGGVINAPPNATSVSFSGGVVAGGDPNTPAKCTLILVVQGVTPGNWLNTYSVNSSTGTSQPASDTLRVNFPPTLTKTFAADSVLVLDRSVTTLTFVIANPNATETLTGVSLGDDFPAGLVLANSPSPTTTCGGSFTAVANSGAFAMTGGTIAGGGSCTITVKVTGLTPGVQNNTAQAASTNGGASNVASDSILVIAPPVIAKQFSSPTVAQNGVVALTFVVVNPNPATVLTGVGFTDNLPAGMSVLANPAPTVACTGAGSGGTLTATAGATSVSVSGATIAAADGNCAWTVFVTPTTSGRKNNTSSVVASVEGGSSTNPATATVLVLAPPVLTKVFASAFNPPSVALNASTTLTFTMTNPNPVDALVDATLVNVTFADDMRQQPGDVVKIVVSTPNGAAGNLCGGTLTAPDGSPAIALQGATIPAASSCVFSISVTGVAAGTENNTTTPIGSDNGGVGLAASATLYVVAPPVIGKAFGAASIIHGDTTTLTVTIANPAENTIPLTGVSFTDILPGGIMIAAPNGLTGSCFNGTITAPTFTRYLSLADASIPVNGSCTFTVTVLGTAQDTENVNVTGTVTSANGGDGNSATATLKVVPRIIPTMSEWALMLMSLLLALSAWVVMRRQGIR